MGWTRRISWQRQLAGPAVDRGLPRASSSCRVTEGVAVGQFAHGFGAFEVSAHRHFSTQAHPSPCSILIWSSHHCASFACAYRSSASSLMELMNYSYSATNLAGME
mmetsp:Transcript_1812/g.4736  ORF Transcript_1812/g.4736 Transcript_1812/m.4736 type:complete len:106 (+) Transcript_1812:2479-2796(+)